MGQKISSIAVIVSLLFLPALLGLGWQAIALVNWASRGLAIALLFLCIDQCRMAIADLEQVAEVKLLVQNAQLEQFHRVTIATIVVELLGFYSAIGWLGWGVAIVLLSQVGFNIFAGIQLQPKASAPIIPWGIRDRLPVFIADGLGLVLIGCWLAGVQPLVMALGLLGMVSIYGLVKYGVL
ncbi:hypothetical protein [Alkalinema sp. FACHB-956]|uniref:hypothetical protein n=1 Tax=Alkalinema sp. FACHB-956 TaxID=2692768 RepID=UPI001689AA36|nr:hypothetical protein [Alkalinema sp. FACHB-956]MBD2329380.1 hypothetical protein [Alkalinema sp. FACHB-956]